MGITAEQMITVPLFHQDSLWRSVKDGYPPAARLYAKHYSAYPYKDNRRADPNYQNRHLICGPGEKLVLMTAADDALLAWRKFKDNSGQVGVNCAIFRNESTHLSSLLITQACAIAWKRWPNERLYTYVNPCAIASPNPGYCFKVAGWRTCGMTKVNKLLILEKSPNV